MFCFCSCYKAEGRAGDNHRRRAKNHQFWNLDIWLQSCKWTWPGILCHGSQVCRVSSYILYLCLLYYYLGSTWSKQRPLASLHNATTVPFTRDILSLYGITTHIVINVGNTRCMCQCMRRCMCRQRSERSYSVSVWFNVVTAPMTSKFATFTG